MTPRKHEWADALFCSAVPVVAVDIFVAGIVHDTPRNDDEENLRPKGTTVLLTPLIYPQVGRSGV